MKKKLNIGDLKVKSFVTTFQDSKFLKGGTAIPPVEIGTEPPKAHGSIRDESDDGLGCVNSGNKSACNATIANILECMM